MEKKLKNIVLEYESKKDKMKKDDIQVFVTRIKFLEHERLVHLEVTLAFAIFTLIFFFFFVYFEDILYVIPFIILLITLICYIIHYYYLENTVQKLHDIYEEIVNKK